MPNDAAFDARLRSVERAATEAAKELAAPDGGNFADAHRNAEEMIEWMQQKYESAGARVDTLSATVRSGKTANRSEVIMDATAAERLFGAPTLGSSRRLPPQSLSAKQQFVLSYLRSYTAHLHGKLPRELQLLAGTPTRAIVPAWKQAILQMDENGKTALALDTLFAQIDSMLSAGEFDKVDDVVAAMPVEGPSLSLMLGLLSITRPAADRLPSRQRFFTRVYRLCQAMRRDAESLLGGLR
jgi:hypothetical protein